MSLRAAVPLLLFGVLACASNPPEAAPPPAASPSAVDAGVPGPSVGGAPVPIPSPAGPGAKEAVAAAGLTPAALYESCRSRVEGRESAGECETDADCMATGCSGEVCVTKEMAAGMATTCEILPCFAALDTCGCVQGVCSWALKDQLDPGRPMPVPLPKH